MALNGRGRCRAKGQKQLVRHIVPSLVASKVQQGQGIQAPRLQVPGGGGSELVGVALITSQSERHHWRASCSHLHPLELAAIGRVQVLRVQVAQGIQLFHQVSVGQGSKVWPQLHYNHAAGLCEKAPNNVPRPWPRVGSSCWEGVPKHCRNAGPQAGNCHTLRQVWQ